MSVEDVILFRKLAKGMVVVMSESERRTQVAAQCKAVSHLAMALAGVHNDYAMIFSNGTPATDFIDRVGARTASFMEQLGDMLNAMDACTEEDEWLEPIFEEAQRLWPQDTVRDVKGRVTG